MPHRVHWDAELATGQPQADQQHQALLALCNRMADLCVAGDEPGFDAAFVQLKALASEHFEAENVPEDRDEFQFLVDDIATTENFDRLELQRFLAFWWLGHVRDAASQG